MVRTTRPNQKKGDIPNKDTFTRINFMYQATHLTLRHNPKNTELIRFYCNSVKSIAKKQVLRLHPHIKRHICKKCAMLLVPGVTATVRKKDRGQRHLVVRCLECKTPKRFPMNANYELWGEQPSAWVSMYPEDAPLPTESGNTPSAASGSSQPAEISRKCKHKRCRSRSICRKRTKGGNDCAAPETACETLTVSPLGGNESEPLKDDIELANLCQDPLSGKSSSRLESGAMNGTSVFGSSTCEIDNESALGPRSESQLGKLQVKTMNVEDGCLRLGLAKCDDRENQEESSTLSAAKKLYTFNTPENGTLNKKKQRDSTSDKMS